MTFDLSSESVYQGITETVSECLFPSPCYQADSFRVNLQEDFQLHTYPSLDPYTHGPLLNPLCSSPPQSTLSPSTLSCQPQSQDLGSDNNNFNDSTTLSMHASLTSSYVYSALIPPNSPPQPLSQCVFMKVTGQSRVNVQVGGTSLIAAVVAIRKRSAMINTV